MRSISNVANGFHVAIMFLLTLCTTVFIWGVGLSGAAPMVTDASISDAVEDELLLDRNIRAHLIDVNTHEGIVTLSGGVDNILARQRAMRIAETVKGVRAVVNTIRVLPPVLRSDDEIRDDVNQALVLDPATDSYEVDVVVKDNVVTLSGTVDSWQERELCATVAMGVKGVKTLNNEIVFKYKESRPDAEIMQDVSQALRWDVLVDHALIDVDVKNGNVALSGTVGSLAEKMRAIGDAYVANVNTVDAKKLEVRLWARDPQLKGDKYKNLSDNEIHDAVKDALFYDPRVASFEVTPQVISGVVTLRGTVDNLKARRAAAQTAGNTVGVTRVVDRLKVRPLQRYSDDTLESRIADAFIRDPVVDAFGITVNVRNGTVDLFGTVGTFFEKKQAEDIASRVKGVVAVNNYLVVAAFADPYLDDWRYTRDMMGPHYGPPLRPFKTDADIKEEIEDEFFWSPFVNDDDITVSVDDGTATLTGTVGSWMEYNAASDNAYEGGATRVSNQLKVR